MERIKPPNEMDFSTVDDTSVAEKWRQWRQTMELFIELSMPDKSEKEKCSAFLYIIGQAGRDIFNAFVLTAEERDKINILFAKFESYCKPKRNVTVERYKFNTRMQAAEESIDQFVTALRLIAKDCDFKLLEDDLIRDRIVCGTNSDRVKERLLREHDLTLDKAINICRSTEESKKQLESMSEEKADPKVHTVKPAPADSEERSSIPRGKIDRCRNCGLQHGRDSCPARGRKCHKCHRMNHFAKLCRSGQVSTIGKDEEISDGKQQYMVGTIKENGVVVSNNECFSTFQVNGVRIKFKIDTGSQVNVLSLYIFKQMSKRPHLDTAKIRLIGYTGDALSVVGRCELIVQGHPLEFYIVRTNQSPILGLKASQDLHVIKVIMNVGCQSILSQYSKVFEGLGCLSKSYHIKVDPEVTPVICPPRNQPVAIRDRLKHELDDMESLGVIKKVEEPTDWVNSLVVVEKPKSKKLRICLDPRPLNKAILREHFQLPTLEDIATRLSGARIFSKLDANHGYWQIPLDDESQQLTTFNSPFGRYCFTRMPFGIKSAQEIFQKRMTQNFGDLEGVETDIDDILVWGKTEEEHHKRLKAVLQRCQDIHLTLNMEKCKFGAPQVTYLGHIISAAGISLDKDRVKAISEMPPPTDRKGVERILGTLNYVAKFVPDMSMITQPIRELLKQDTQFIWEYEQEAAFEAIKTRLSTTPVLAFFDVQKTVTVSCDASQSGLGAVLLQEGRPIAYVSRALTSRHPAAYPHGSHGHHQVHSTSQRSCVLARLNKEITEMVEKCDACQNYQYSNQKEPMVQGQIPEGPWDMVATDLFQWDGADYLLIVDYYSRFIEFCRLPNTSSSMVIIHTKSIFARHGIPKSVRSDNGPQFSAMEYGKFAEEWGFAHVTSSPYHPQSNGLAEKSVQIIKRMLNKSKRDGQDPYLNLLELRNTRVGDIGSPAQLLMGRRLRTSLPVKATQLEPRTINPDCVKSHLQQEQQKRKLYYDEGSKPLIPLQKGENAWMQIQGEWKPVKVLGTAEAPASYHVKSASCKVYRRNRKHLRPRRADDLEDQSESDLEVDSESGQEQVNNQTPDDDNSGLQGQPGVPPATLEGAQEVEVQNRQQAEVRTSSGRLVRKPQRYKDFVAL
eukprot:Em0001g1018a